MISIKYFNSTKKNWVNQSKGKIFIVATVMRMQKNKKFLKKEKNVFFENKSSNKVNVNKVGN
jgi:hypothetical protein